MGEFRIGRKFAQHSYPDTPRGAVAAFARNSAVGPTGTIPIVATPVGGPGTIDACGTHVPWSIIESTGAAGPSVPITPRVTGRIRSLATVVVQSTSEGSIDVRMGLVVDSGAGFSPVLHVVEFTVLAGDFVTIPLVLDGILPLNVTSQVGLVLRASSEPGAQLALLPNVCGGEVPVVTATIDLQELPPPTG